MTENTTLTKIKEIVAGTGRILLEKKLVARTWGNFSCRIDDSHFAITPSGLGYENLTSDDIPVFNMEDETWEGRVKPSSEKRIHAAAYRIYPDVNFVVHTHQNYGTAIGLVGVSELEMTNEEKELLGPIAIASYGLPGTKKLKNAVQKAFESGSKTILMIHHGAVICGKNREDAIYKSEVLEKVCKRAFDKKIGNIESIKTLDSDKDFISKLDKTLKENFAYHKIISNPLVIRLANEGTFHAQLDDMSQMLGSKLQSIELSEKKVLKVLSKKDAVLVKGVGLVVKADDKDDVDALEILIEKAGLARLYTNACGNKIKLSSFDCALMHIVYKMKYSKKKDSNKNSSSGDGSGGDSDDSSGTVSGVSGAASSGAKKTEIVRILKFVGFSISAGVIELISETLLEKLLPWEKMTENPQIKYWVSYLVALVLSVIWNFTFNRKFTFKSATNVPIAMLKVALFYVVFTPLTTYLQKFLCGFDWGSVDNLKGQFTTGINMALNLTTEYVYDRFFVFRKSLDTKK